MCVCVCCLLTIISCHSAVHLPGGQVVVVLGEDLEIDLVLESLQVVCVRVYCLSVCLYACMYTCVCVYVYIYICIYMYIYVYMHMYV